GVGPLRSARSSRSSSDRTRRTYLSALGWLGSRSFVTPQREPLTGPQGSAILRAAATGRPAPDRPAPPAAPRGRTWPGGGRRSRRPRASARPRTSPGWSVSLPVDTFERLGVSHPTNTPERATLCSSGVDGSQDTVGEEGHASEPFAAGGG